jgi:hypothetical protein
MAPTTISARSRSATKVQFGLVSGRGRRSTLARYRARGVPYVSFGPWLPRRQVTLDSYDEVTAADVRPEHPRCRTCAPGVE